MHYKYWIKEKYLVTCTRKDVTTKLKRNLELHKHVQHYAGDLKKRFEEPVFYHDYDMYTEATFIRNYESAFGSFVCDLIRYDICSDIVLLSSGAIRSDVLFKKGYRILGDIYDIFPFTTQICKLEASGEIILKLLNNSVSKWPIQEGKFCQVSGVRFFMLVCVFCFAFC